MAFKIFHIGKANARIDELEQQLAALTKERDELKAAAESNASEVTTQAEGLQAKLTEADGKVSVLTGEVSALKASIDSKDGEIKTLTDKLANTAKEIEAAASKKALEITAAQGQPPISATPQANPATTENKTELKGLAKTRAAFEQQINKTK